MAVVRAGLGGQFTLERARAAMIACVLRALHFHTPQSMLSMRGAPVVRDRCHACRMWVVSRWGVSDAHGEAARALIDTYVEYMANDGADRTPPFDRPRESVHSDVVCVVAARFAHLAHTEGILVCWACAIPRWSFRSTRVWVSRLARRQSLCLASRKITRRVPTPARYARAHVRPLDRTPLHVTP